MEETELEEGEALCYNGVEEDSTIDPDVAFSYIGEKLQDVLGHFQKDFEGGVSAENLGAKFGGYGSFLPTYQRSPSRSHANTAPEIQEKTMPNSATRFHLEDQTQSSSASRSVSPTARLHAASGKTMLMGNSLKVDVDLPFKQVNESSLNLGVSKKSVNTSDQRILKVRIKVGSDKVPTQKNADIYNGLGLVVSPSSLLDESPATSKPPSRNLLDLQEGSLISILQTMTSFYGGLLLSPLSEDLIHLMDKGNLGVIGESELDKMGTKKSGMLVNGSLAAVIRIKEWKPSERDSSFTELKNHKSSSDKNYSVSSLKKENETDIDTVECDELISSALKLPLLSNSHYASDVVIGMDGDFISSGMAGKKCLDTEPAQDICRAEKLTESLGLSTGLSESKKGKFDSSIAACSLHYVRKAEKARASGEYESNDCKGTKNYSAAPIDSLKQFPVQKEGSGSEKGSKSALEKSSSGAQRKVVRVPSISSKVAYMSKDKLNVDFSLSSKRGKISHPDSDSLVSKNGLHDLRKEKHGNLGFGDDNESISGEMASTGRIKDHQRMSRISESDYHDGLKDNCNKLNSENPRSSEVCSMSASHRIAPGNGPSSEAPTGMAAPLNEDWVSCDNCGKWRLLPLGTNPKCLPNKWLCRMLTWLPGMNRCSVPEEETSNALRAQALYHPSASVQLNQINNSLGTSVTVPSVQTHNDNKQEPLVNCSDTVVNSKTRSKRESDLDGSRASKRLKENEQFDYEKGISDHGGASIKANSSINSLKPEIHAPSTSDYCLRHSSIHDDKDSIRKRKGEEHHGSQSHVKPLSFSGHCQQRSGEFVDEMCESDHVKEKKVRVSNSRNQQNGHYLMNSQAEDYLKGDKSLVRSSVTANSSSSKVSGSRKHKAFAQEVKGSPVESVSSYPLRFYNADKVTSTRKNLIGKDDFQDSLSLTGMSPKRFSAGEDDRGNDQTGMVKTDAVVCDIPFGDKHSASEKYSFEQCQIEGKTNAGLAHGSVSHLKKREKGLASHKDKSQTSGSDSGKEKIKAFDSSCDYLYHGHDEEKYKSRRNKFDDESSPPGKAEKFVSKKDTAGGTLSESSKGRRGQIKYEGHDGQEVTIKRHNLLQEHDDNKLCKKSDQVEVNENGNSLSLPPLARIQTETVASVHPVSGSHIENIEKSAFGNGDALKASRQSKKRENQNDQPSSSRNPKLHKARDAEVPSPVRRDSNSQAANNALKEAKDLKHLADRLKHSGSGESNGLYFEASLKFLHAASLLESGSTEGSKHNDVHSMNIYSSTAKLCEFCAHEYEKSKDMATAALAYKCTEVAYMRVVYSSHSRAGRDRNDLQTSLQIFPPGDSPSSSASDVDNLNHASTDNSTGLTKVGEPGSHVITSQNRSGFLRLLNFAQDITFALEASRKSRNAYAAASSKLGETLHKDGITSLKKALDFNFQDVQGLLRLVRVSMEVINS
ncbi:LOW QUALITY PROTEIN: cysteine-tryptophan domain-containing zinc finger protein 3-like [Primulina eburnea]|uniref:LOW QUALITY PROTEIN: cysteine-tryptophan domain-containing zinc finger protein 3-like n=1 Tax=Primulina eburnea TaxID=1245227 RepID=UPI003C6C696D